MPKRISVILDEENIKKLRKKQSVMIRKSMSHVSFSSVINEVLRKALAN